jgi:tetraacyldisaccharide 4'-kinase
MGENPAIVSRGYGGTSCAKVATVSDGTKLYLSAREAGDEPVLLARRLPGIPVVIGANRVEAAAEAVSRWGATVLVTDDGFQHLRLKRDVNVVVMDATAPFGNGYVLPRGMLREPSSALRDADLIVLTRSGGLAPEELEELREKLGRLSPGTPVVQSVHEFAALRDWPDGAEKEPKELSGQKILAFAGIGNPEAFFSEIDRLGAQLVETAPFPDHHVYTKGDMELLLNRARRANADRLVTTEKDAVKIEPFLPLALPLGVLTLRMGFPAADIRHLETLLKRVVQTGRKHSRENAE